MDFSMPQKFSEWVSYILGRRRGTFLWLGVSEAILLSMSMKLLLYLDSRTIFLSTVNLAFANLGC